MKQIRFVIILFLLPFIIKAQDLCKTIVLKDGHKYTGVIVAANSDAIKFENCNIENRPLVAVFTSDVAAILRPGTGDTISYSQLKKEMRIQRFQTNEKARSEKKEKKLDQVLDTVKYVHYGIIPYQFLTRSSGLYLRFDLKKISLEYRLTYTYAFASVNNYVTGGVLPIYYDNYYFQGINNSFLFFKSKPFKKNQIGIILSYKYWWHGNQSIDNDQSGFVHDDVDFKEIKSTYMNGIGAGVEYTRDIGNNNFDCNFFMNATFTDFIAYSHVVSLSGGANIPPYAYTQTYPYNETKNRPYINLTLGFKLGYKKQLTK